MTIDVDVLVLADFRDLLEVCLDAVHQHALEVGLVHAL